MKRIQENSAIWDLHIHTCKCPKGSSEFVKYDKEKFIEKIRKEFDSNDDFQLFSFTDHNQISIDVYQEYIDQGGKTNFLVGVEQDTYFDEKVDNDSKHLIIYFDIDISNFNNNIKFLEEYNSFVNQKKKKISELLNFLVRKKIKFVLSPHAWKQGKRGIENKWTTEDIVNDEAHKYTDQFFCFWEAQGYSSIAKAEEFLKSFDMEDKISIISFSDSNNFEKLKSYIQNPWQWFKSLPNFKGLELIATENSRIFPIKHYMDEANFGNLIGKIVLKDQEIKLSDKLNCIIGGRGSGKSLLLDMIATNLSEVDIPYERKQYIDNFSVKIFNYGNGEIGKNNFAFDYFKQSYVSELFNSNDYFFKIKEQFQDELNQIEEIDVNEIKEGNLYKFSSYLNEYPVHDQLDNISNFINKYSLISDNSFKNSLMKKDKSKLKIIDYNKYKNMDKKIINLLPNPLKENKNILEEIYKLIYLVKKETNLYNVKFINNDAIKNNMIDYYMYYKANKSSAQNEKIKVEELFRKTFDNKSYLSKMHVNTINAYIKMQREFTKYFEEKNFFNGEIKNAFIVKKVLLIETPFEYLTRKFKEYFYYSEIGASSKDSIMDLRKAINYYCFSNDYKLKDDKTIEELDKDLKCFDLKYDYHPEILYLIGNEYENIMNVSPGTQTNVLMEYLVFKDTNKPILIDQPEDNVDNQTIYNKLRVWFSSLKLKRQVIVVTHDANIVINSDAENIIIAKHTGKDKFEYSYGALEYGENLEEASEILDGGKEAVKRRLMKYGE